MRWAWFGLGVGAVLAVLAIGGWVASEVRYGNCLAAAEARWPVAFQQPSEVSGDGFKLELEGFRSFDAEFVYEDQDEREEAIDSCSRLP